jgi:hypothetical protein
MLAELLDTRRATLAGAAQYEKGPDHKVRTLVTKVTGDRSTAIRT